MDSLTNDVFSILYSSSSYVYTNTQRTESMLIRWTYMDQGDIQSEMNKKN